MIQVSQNTIAHVDYYTHQNLKTHYCNPNPPCSLAMSKLRKFICVCLRKPSNSLVFSKLLNLQYLLTNYLNSLKDFWLSRKLQFEINGQKKKTNCGNSWNLGYLLLFFATRIWKLPKSHKFVLETRGSQTFSCNYLVLPRVLTFSLESLIEIIGWQFRNSWNWVHSLCLATTKDLKDAWSLPTKHWWISVSSTLIKRLYYNYYPPFSFWDGPPSSSISTTRVQKRWNRLC